MKYTTEKLVVRKELICSQMFLFADLILSYISVDVDEMVHNIESNVVRKPRFLEIFLISWFRSDGSLRPSQELHNLHNKYIQLVKYVDPYDWKFENIPLHNYVRHEWKFFKSLLSEYADNFNKFYKLEIDHQTTNKYSNSDFIYRALAQFIELDLGETVEALLEKIKKNCNCRGVCKLCGITDKIITLVVQNGKCARVYIVLKKFLDYDVIVSYFSKVNAVLM